MNTDQKGDARVLVQATVCVDVIGDNHLSRFDGGLHIGGREG